MIAFFPAVGFYLAGKYSLGIVIVLQALWQSGILQWILLSAGLAFIAGTWWFTVLHFRNLDSARLNEI